MSEQPYTILIVDDDDLIVRSTLAALLEKPNYHIEMACATRKESADKGQRLLDEGRVLSDQLPAERRATAIHPGLEAGRINYVQSEN